MILSIPHTGTHFLRQLFDGQNVEMGRMHLDRKSSKRILGDRPVIVPLRNPAKTMISHWKRGARGVFHGLAQDFRYLSEGHFNARYVPLDNGAPPVTRMGYLKDALGHINVELPDKYIYDYALNWMPAHSKGATLDDMLYATDYAAFAERCPDIVHALGTIKDLMPFFQERGYAKFKWA